MPHFVVVYVVTIVVLIVVHRICNVYRRADELWAKATPDRRKERLGLVLFVGNRYCSTGFTISRAYESILSGWFGGKCAGVLFEAVLVIPVRYMSVTANTTEKIGHLPVGTRSETHRKHWIFDIGASGLCSASKSKEKNAAGELYEELGISSTSDGNNLMYVRTFMPCEGYGVIIHLYLVDVAGMSTARLNNLASTDGTYSKISWVPFDSDSIYNYMNKECLLDTTLKTSKNDLTTRNLAGLLCGPLFDALWVDD